MTTKKTVILLITIPLGIIIFLFLGIVGWYTWQLSSGSDEVRRNLIETFDPDTFSAIAGSTRTSDFIPNAAQYIRPHNPTFGSMTAPITILAFIDFECQYSRRSYTTFETIRERYAPVIHVVFKHFPLESIHPNAASAAMAAQCASEQRSFWTYYQTLFVHQVLHRDAYAAYATDTNLLLSEFTRCTENPLTRAQVEQDMQDGVAIGVRGTPTYVVNGHIIEGVIPEDVWNEIMLMLLNQPNAP